MACLTVMLDHVAGLRQSMQIASPDPAAAAVLAEAAGADGIGLHLREDRRHTRERDLRVLRQIIQSRLIMHMSPTSEMVGIAMEIKPERVILRHEPREEKKQLEGGIDLVVHGKELSETVQTLQNNGIGVGICIAPEPEQAKIAHQLGADWIQVHAGRLRSAKSPAAQRHEWDRIVDTIKLSRKLRLQIALGHGLDERLIKLFKGVPEIDEFSLGRCIVAKALLVGMDRAVRQISHLLQSM